MIYGLLCFIRYLYKLDLKKDLILIISSIYL